jgi:hypothetical protein
LDAEVIEELRRAAKAAQELEGYKWGQARSDTFRPGTMLNLGVALTWYGDLDEARQVLGEALAYVERVRTGNGRSLALTALTVAAWRQGDAELVRELVPQARGEAVGGGAVRYHMAGVTAALEAWVNWNEHRTEQVIALGTEALELWKSHLQDYPFC